MRKCKQLNEHEIFRILYFNCKSPNGYNCTDGGTLCDEAIAKISAKMTECKFSQEHIAKLTGRKLSPQDVLKKAAATRKQSPYKNLQSLIAERELTYKDIAPLFGVSRSAVYMKIRGERNFTDNDKIKLEEIFGKSAEYLLQRYDE